MLLDAVDLTVPLEMRFAGEVRMALALLRIDQHRPAEALALLEPGLQVASLLGMPVTQLVAPIRAFALDALAQTDAADQILIDALSRAAPEGLVHPFRVLGQRLVPLLRRLQHTLAPTHSAYTLVTTLLATTKGTTGRAGQTATLTPAPHQLRRGAVAQPLIEPLSARELEVLALLAHGATNQQIADQLIISERTAKKHVTNILGKLDATNRTQAVARAREVGLLP
jgi:LuxR family maltose regulon positive regulatory protein